MNFHSYEKQIFKSFSCTKIGNESNEVMRTQNGQQQFTTLPTSRQVLTVPLLTEEALFTWAFRG